MDRLWAPWRSKYIYLRKHKGCIFCKKTSGAKTGHVISKSRSAFAMLNLYPYNNGHVMVAPYRHVKSLELLNDEELLDILHLVNRVKSSIDRALKPDGYNIGLNIGKTGGAGFAGHVHVHIVPRWAGDTNFMPLIAGTKVVSESLEAMKSLLKNADA